MAEQESVYLWSTTALTNASVDPAINFAEGQLPGTLNNSNRAEMAALARYVKDTDGSLTTAGSANAYTLTINGRQTPLATGHFLTFKASFTNTAAATLAVTNADAVALGTKAIRGPGDVALAAGQMISGGVYQCRYDTAANSADGAWILLNPYVDGLLANNRVAKTANYTLAATEKGKTVALGGSTHFTLTVSAASGYDTNFAALIINEDSGRGKTLAINGYTSFILWPGQQIMLLNQNNVWQFQMPPVWSCPVGTTWNVNHASGVNSGDGLGTGASAWATIQYAVDQLLAHIYSPKSNIIIQLAAETFTESVTVSSTVGATSGIQINGNSTSTPANSTWQTSGTALLAFDNAFVLLNGIRLVGTGSGNVGLRASKFGFIEVVNIEYGGFTAGLHVVVDQQGFYNYGGGTYTVNGNIGTHIFMFGGTANIGAVAISMPTIIGFTQWVYAQGSGTSFNTSATYTGAGSGSGTSKYTITMNATAFLNGTTLPGGAGSTATGGQVSP